MNFKEIQKLLEKDLELVGKEITKSLDSPISFIGKVASYLIESGGKRFRPIVLILSAKAFGYENERIYTIASILEFIHTATLLHDDVVDYAELRRGQPTANILWGNEATVLVGDFLLARSFLKLVQDGDLEVLDCVSRATTKMAEGELLQLLKTNEPQTTEEEYLEIVKSKTAVLISAASEIGAILGNASIEEKIRMREFGMNLGIAFQIVDDTIDYLVEDQTMGKTRGQDYFDGKATLPFIYAYKNSDEKNKAFLESLFLKEEKNKEDFERLFSYLKKMNAFEESFNIARSYVNKAKESIYFLKEPYKNYLKILADYTLERTI